MRPLPIPMDGLQDHQAWIVAHRDTAHPHVHVMVNRVHPDTGKAWSASHDYRRIEHTLRQLEQRWDLVRVPGHHARAKGIERPERSHSGGRRGARAFAREVHQAVGPALSKANTWQELLAELRAHGLRLEARSRGVVVTDGRRHVGGCRIASLGSRPQLEVRYGQSLQSYVNHGTHDSLPTALRPARRRAQQHAYRRWRSNAALRSAYVDVRVFEAVRAQHQGLNSAQVAHRQAQFTLRQAHAQHQRASQRSVAFRDALKEVYRQLVQAYRAFWRMAGARSLEHAIQDLQVRPEGFGALRSAPRKAGLGLFTVSDTTAARAAARVGWRVRRLTRSETCRRRLIAPAWRPWSGRPLPGQMQRSPVVCRVRRRWSARSAPGLHSFPCGSVTPCSRPWGRRPGSSPWCRKSRVWIWGCRTLAFCAEAVLVSCIVFRISTPVVCYLPSIWKPPW